MDKPKYIVLDKTESVYQSFKRDVVTVGLMLLGSYLAPTNLWFWIFITITVLFIAAKSMKSRYMTFHSKEELQKWLDSEESEE